MTASSPALCQLCLGKTATFAARNATGLCRLPNRIDTYLSGLRPSFQQQWWGGLSSRVPNRPALSPLEWNRTEPLASRSSRTFTPARVSAESPPSKGPENAPGQAGRPPVALKGGVIPLLTFGKDGQLALDVDPDYGQAPKRGAPADVSKSPAESAVPKWKGVPSPSKRDGLDRPSGPPKYSKAARRYYNETFRKAERLSKVLAAAGVASRRASEEMIFAGRVTVNGVVCKVPQTSVDLNKDNIYVDGQSLPKKAPPKLYFVVNKPKGYICSSVASGSQKPALDLVDDYMKTWVTRNRGTPKPRLFTVGRLDVNTTGLLLITNDGDMAQKAGHPSSGLTKEYIVKVDTQVTRRQLAVLEEGVMVDGVHCRPVTVELIPSETGVRIRIVVSEGRTHEVRNIVANAGLEVKALKRVRIGGLRLERTLGIGKYTVLAGPQLENLLFRES